MSGLKRYFVLPYLLACFLVCAYAIWTLVQGTNHVIAWAGVLVAVGPMLGFMAWLVVSNSARSSRNLPLQLSAAVVGTVMAAYDFALLPSLLAFDFGLLGVIAYVFWYSDLGRGYNAELQVGQQLPSFSVETASGELVSSESFHGKKALFMFYRGNWCPLCVAQVKEVAAKYRELKEAGVEVAMISPQSHGHTADIAKRFDVPMQFFSDPGNRAAERLGISHKGGTPAGMPGYDSDTVFPTVLATDESGTIIYADLTDNYRVRPEPEDFMHIFSESGVAAGV